MKTLKPTESQIQTQILRYLLHRKDIFVQRTNNIPVSQIENGKRVFRKMPFGQRAGFPDITVIKDGKFIGIEVKKGGKYLRNGKVNKKGDWKYAQSEEQEVMEKLIKKAGGEYHVVRSLEDVVKILG